MKVETNLDVIKAKGVENEHENFQFRRYLKMLNMDSEKIDSIVHELNKKVSAEIDCTQCANCCKTTSTDLDTEDIVRFSEGLKQSPEEFRRDYLVKSTENPGMYSLDIVPCPFLKDNKCCNYDHRPSECASYPHLHKADFTQRLFGVLSNYS
ncbi:MAG: YkgJ family cysteine cluster protein, partial [Ignavibacteriales bacterium]|nr:YkgJ family cysteine cluster protein [Ignavibacteriales bacterium]